MSGPAIVLCEPQLGENIGAVARAMANFGLRDLRLVAPRDGWPNERAWPSAAGADEVLAGVRVFDDVAAAVGDCRAVTAATARRRKLMLREVPLRELVRREDHAILFGGERSGLSNSQLRCCEELVQIPSESSFPSLNLAHAVAIVGYELRMRDPVRAEQPPPASKRAVEVFNRRLEEELSKRGFFRVPEMREIMQANLSALIQRAQPREQEIRTLHGVLGALIAPRVDQAAEGATTGDPFGARGSRAMAEDH